jgi:two-component system LytT family sensor kinase
VIDRKTIYYLICQLAGWGLFWLVVHYLFGNMMLRCAIVALSGLLSTHVFRVVIRRYGWMELPFKKGWPRLEKGIVLVCVLAGSIKGMAFLFFTHVPEHSIAGILKFLFFSILSYFFLIPAWTIIYCICHYVSQGRRSNLMQQRLEGRLKEIAADTDGAATNLDQLMDALSEIRDSITDNPIRARNQLTLFSRLLRKGYLDSK